MGKFSNWKVELGLSIALVIFLLASLQTCKAQNRQTLYISSILNPPFLMKVSDPSPTGGNSNYEGYTKDLAEELASRMGFNYNFQLHTAKDQAYGSKLEDGSWTGLIGDLLNSRVGNPMVIADLSVTRERAEVVDFSIPFLQFRLAVLVQDPNFKQPQQDSNIAENEDTEEDDEESAGDLVWFRPFTTPLWLVFILSALLLLLLIYFLEKLVYQKTAAVQNNAVDAEKIFHNFSGRVFGKLTKSVAARFLQVTLWIFLIVFISAYTANFAADQILDILDTTKDLPLKSVDDLVKQDKIKYGTQSHGATYNYFKTSNNSQIQEMFKTMEEGGQLVQSYERGITKTGKSNGTFAFIMEAPAAQYASIRKPCNLALLPQQFGPKKGFAVALQKESPLLRQVNLILLELNDSGFLSDLEEKWFKDNSQCDNRDTNKEIHVEEDYDPLTVDSMAGVFCLIGFAAILVIVIAVIEVALISKSNQK